MSVSDVSPCPCPLLKDNYEVLVLVLDSKVLVFDSKVLVLVTTVLVLVLVLAQ